MALWLSYWCGFKRFGFSLQLYKSWPCANHFRSPHMSFPFEKWGVHPNELTCGESQGCLKQETKPDIPAPHQQVELFLCPSAGLLGSVMPRHGMKWPHQYPPSSLRAPGSCAHSLCWHSLTKLPEARISGQGSAQAAQALAPHAELWIPVSISTAVARGFM